MLNEKRKAEDSDKPEPYEAVKLSCWLCGIFNYLYYGIDELSES